MAENKTIEAPDFDTIEKEGGIATRNAISLLYQALNVEASLRRSELRAAKNLIAPRVLVALLTASQNNLDLEGASILLLTGTTAVNITGLRAPSTNQSRILFVHNVGSATHTFKHASASSDAENRFRNQSLGDNALTTDRTLIYSYLNSLWREQKLL